MSGEAKTHRGWSIDLTPAGWMATSPNYDASYEGEEDGWVDNGEKVTASTVEGLHAEIDAWIDEHADPSDAYLLSAFPDQFVPADRADEPDSPSPTFSRGV